MFNEKNLLLRVYNTRGIAANVISLYVRELMKPELEKVKFVLILVDTLNHKSSI